MISFNEGDQVFLCVLEHSGSLKTGPVPKLSPGYCGPFTILKRVGDVTYKLGLPVHSRVHLVFHVCRLRKRLGDDAIIVDTSVLVDFIEPPVQPHEPERILDFHEKLTRHHVRNKSLVRWKDKPEEGSTWENISILRILDFHEQPTRHHVHNKALVKWKEKPQEGSTWENISVLKKRFPTFVLRTKTLP